MAKSWEDTIIKLKVCPETIWEGKTDTLETKLAYAAGFKEGTEKQAEITWKAALEYMRQADPEKWDSHDGRLEEAYQAGRQEVMKWIKENIYDASGEHSICGIFAIPDYKLKAKFKELGIKE